MTCNSPFRKIAMITLAHFAVIVMAVAAPLSFSAFGGNDGDGRPGTRTMEMGDKELRELSMSIIDKYNRKRRRVLHDLSMSNVHPDLIPALLAIARDPKDSFNADAMFALSNVRKKEAIGFLIDLTWSGSGIVRLNARRMIQVRLPELNYEVIGDRDDEEIIFREYQKLKDWWGEHRDETEIDWDAEPIP